ncbi:hypothetical protein, partial [Rickettsiella grylli]|uniref:hypothetical protein n=1 Tax=Rickettsiella grylli TaxID=59196 RepID=UPI000A811B9B
TFLEDFEWVSRDSECAQESITKPLTRPSNDFRHFRLNATQLNNLNLSYLIRFATENQYVIQEGVIKTGNRNISTHYKQLSKNNKNTFVIFQAVSDVKSSTTLNNLAYINQVIQRFKEENPELNAILLLPFNQSRFGKRHSVLVEVLLRKTELIKITLHNSQSKWASISYPNCLNDLKQTLQIKGIQQFNYGKQNDTISCGFFVHRYIQSILENKNANRLVDVYVTLKARESNPTLIEDTLNENVLKKYPDARKITESGSPLPWVENDLEQALNKACYQTLNDLKIDFDDNLEEALCEKTQEMHEHTMAFRR